MSSAISSEPETIMMRLTTQSLHHIGNTGEDAIHCLNIVLSLLSFHHNLLVIYAYNYYFLSFHRQFSV